MSHSPSPQSQRVKNHSTGTLFLRLLQKLGQHPPGILQDKTVQLQDALPIRQIQRRPVHRIGAVFAAVFLYILPKWLRRIIDHPKACPRQPPCQVQVGKRMPICRKPIEKQGAFIGMLFHGTHLLPFSPPPLPIALHNQIHPKIPQKPP